MFRIIENHKTLFMGLLRCQFENGGFNNISDLLKEKIEKDNDVEAFVQGGLGWGDTKQGVIDRFVGRSDSLVNVQAFELNRKLLKLDASEDEIKSETVGFLSDIHKSVAQSLGTKESLDESYVLKKLEKIDLSTKDRIAKFKLQKERDTISSDLSSFESLSFKNKIGMKTKADQIIEKGASFNSKLEKSKYSSQVTSISPEKLQSLKDISDTIQSELDGISERAKELRKYFLRPQLEKFTALSLLNQEKEKVLDMVKKFNKDLKDLGFKVSIKIEETGFIEKFEKRRGELEKIQRDADKKRAEEKQKSIGMAEKVLRAGSFVFIDTAVFTKSLRKGSKGPDVEALQKFLGFKNPDGKFGPQTENYLMAYQKLSGSTGRNVDGVLSISGTSNDKTLGYIEADVAKLAPKGIKEDSKKENKKIPVDNQIEEEKNDGTKGIEKEKKTYENGIKKFEEVKTKEKTAKVKTTFMGISLGTKERAALEREVNQDSLSDILHKGNLGTIIGELEDQLHTNDLSKITYTQFLFFTDSDIKGVGKVLKKHGYTPNGLFGYQEAAALVSIISGYHETQKILPNWTPREKMATLVDFDKNGKLQIDKNFYVGELQMDFHAFDSLTAGDLDILFKNLGLGTYVSFSQGMAHNLYVARERFQRALGVMLERGIQPAELMIEGGVEKANDRIYEKREEAVQKIGEEVDKYVLSKLSKLKKLEQDQGIEGITDIEGISRAIKLEAVGLLVSPDSVGVGASFNIEKLPLFFDSLEVGLFLKNDQLVPGIAVSKKLLDKNGFTATWTQAFLVVPVFTGTYTMDQQLDEFQRLYPKKIKGKVGLSPYVSGTYHVIGGGIALSRKDEGTSSGIEEMSQKMFKILEVMGKDIQEGKGFEESSFASLSENKTGDAKLYEEMKSVYDRYAKGKPYEKEFLADMITGYISYYENQLYKNAKGTKATSIGVGGAMIYGIFPILYLTVGGEHISTKWESVIHGVDRSREITRKSLDLGTLGVKEVEYKGHKVLFVPNIENYTGISSSIGSTQAEIVDGNAYISGDLSTFTIDDYTTHEGVYRAIILGEGEKDEKTGRYESTEIVDITSSIDGSLKSEEIFQNDLEAIESTKAIRGNLFNIIQYDALNHPKTIGMLKLQKMIFNYKKSGTPALSSLWSQFNRVVTDPGFKEYAKEGGKQGEVDILLDNLSSVKSESEKVLIVQSVASNFMKKSLLQNIDNDPAIEIADGKTIDWYDRKYGRAAYFDRQFKKKFPALLGKIQDARKEWNRVNKDATEYTFQPISDGSIVYTGVESKKRDRSINISGIMSYTGAYNVAKIGRGKDFIEIPGRSPEVVNNLPKRVLENIRVVLNKNGADLKNIQQVKEFINNGGNKSVKVDYKLAFTRMGECLNDSVVIKDITIIKDGKSIKIGATTTGEVYSPTHKVVNWGIAFHGETKRRKEKQNEGGGNNDSNDNDDSSTPDGNEGEIDITDPTDSTDPTKPKKDPNV